MRKLLMSGATMFPLIVGSWPALGVSMCLVYLAFRISRG